MIGKPVRKSASFHFNGDASSTLREVLREGMIGGIFDAVLVPVPVPGGDGYAHILIKDRRLLERAVPLPPIIPKASGKAVVSLTRRGKGDLKVAIVLRPCEMRGAVELIKLGQIEPTNLTFITMDCPGALPLQDFAGDHEGQKRRFAETESFDDDRHVRPICRICVNMSLGAADLHLGLKARTANAVPLISQSEKGQRLLDAIGSTSRELSDWDRKVDKAASRRVKQRGEWHESFAPKVQGTDNLLNALSTCINCHNCMRACPVCYCRLCYFDSEHLRHEPSDYLAQARRKGGLRFPPDMMLFHLGRMNHIGLTCVSCGMCEDACPAGIPIAQMFSLVSERAQRTFDYSPGRDASDPLPLMVYREQELEEEKE
ncbi:MAG: hypothetical protein LUO79_03875 [Methanomassiliicoccales archaeon]|nr:hypothetical protein [Methanomassiliicoccales archaeon]